MNMMKPLILAAMLALTACVSTTDVASRDVHIGTDWGGNFSEYRSRVGGLLFNDQTVRVTGVCASSCTMFLVLGPDRVCSTPQARWAFHSVYHPRTGAISQTATAELVASYPASLQSWFWTHAHGKTGRDFAYLSGAQMVAAGYVGEC